MRNLRGSLSLTTAFGAALAHLALFVAAPGLGHSARPDTTASRPRGSWSGAAQPPSVLGGRPMTPGAPGSTSTPASGRPSATVTPVPPQVIARVEGRPITQTAYDRVATPYFAQLRTQMGDAFQGETVNSAKQNVLNELIRQQVVTIEALRQNISVSEKEIDDALRRDAFFQVNGKFDEARFQEFKSSPTSNYQQMLPQLRENLAMNKLDTRLRERFTPSDSTVRQEFLKRNDKIRLKYLLLQPRDMSLDSQATAAERAAYYRAHPEEFMRKTRLRYRYVKLPLPAVDDSTRATAEAAAMRRGEAIADSLRARTMPDTAVGMLDTGLFEVPALSVPGLGRIPELSDALGRADTVTSLRVLGPFAGTDAVVVGVVAGREPRHLPPLREVLGEVKRRADTEKRRKVQESEQRAYHAAHPDSFRGPRVRLTRLTVNEANANIPPPSTVEIEHWYRTQGATLFGRPDSSRAWIPPLNDSLRQRVRERLERDGRTEWLRTTSQKLATGMGTARDVRALARSTGAVVETLTLIRGSAPDTVFTPMFTDSLLRFAATQKGVVQGPRRFGRHLAAWRVDAADTAFVPPYESVVPRAAQLVAEEKRRRDEADGRARFEQFRGEYNMPVRYMVDYVAVAILPADSVKIPEAELRAEYEKTKASLVEEEQVRARHILIRNNTGTPAGDARAKARADSLYAVIQKGVDFVDLVAPFSEDPSNASAGGDLGWFARPRMVKEFSDAAFALERGQVSTPVKTSFGYHLIRLDDRKAARTRPFNEVRREIFTRMAGARADTTARRSANALRRKLAAGGDAKVLAQPYGGLMTGGPFAANEAAPGLGFVQGLGDDVAGLPVNRWAPKVYRSGARYVVLRVKERQPPRPAEFEEVRGKTIADARDAKRKVIFDREVSVIRPAISSGAALDSVAALYTGLKDVAAFPQSYNFVPGLGFEPGPVKTAFALPAPGAVSDTVHTGQGVAWLRLEEKIPADESEFKKAEEQIRQELVTRSYNEWVEARKKGLKIEVIRPDLRSATQPAGSRAARIGG